MSSQTLPIFDYLRNYLLTCNRTIGNAETDIDSISDLPEPVKIYLSGECYDPAYTGKISPEFTSSVAKFSENLSKYDIITTNNSIRDYFSSDISNRNNLLGRALREVSKNYTLNQLSDIPRNDGTNNMLFGEVAAQANGYTKYKVKPQTKFLTLVLNKFLELLNAEITKNNLTTSCDDFIRDVKTISTTFSFTNFIENTVIENKSTLNTIRDKVTQEVFRMLRQRFDESAKKCFTIPVITYGKASPEFKLTCDRYATNVADKSEQDLFDKFFILEFETIDATGKKVPLPQDDWRIQIKKVPGSANKLLILNWIPSTMDYFYDTTNFVDVSKQPTLRKLSYELIVNGTTAGNSQLNIIGQGIDAFIRSPGIKMVDPNPKCSVSGPKPNVSLVKQEVFKWLKSPFPTPSIRSPGSLVKAKEMVEKDPEFARLIELANGWIYQDGKFKKKIGSEFIEYNADTADDFVDEQCTAMGLNPAKCLMFLEGVVKGDTTQLNKIISDPSFLSAVNAGMIKDIHPLLALKVLKVLGFKEKYQTDSRGVRSTKIESFEEWVERFVKSAPGLQQLYIEINADPVNHFNMRLFLKMLVSLINNNPSILGNTSKFVEPSTKPIQPLTPEQDAALTEYFRKKGIKRYVPKSNTSDVPRMSLNDIRRGLKTLDPFYQGIRFNELDLLGSYNDVTTSALLPFLRILTGVYRGDEEYALQGFNIDFPSVENLTVRQTGGVSETKQTSFKLYSEEIEKVYKGIVEKLNRYNKTIDVGVKQKMEKSIEDMRVLEKDILENLLRMQKYSQIVEMKNDLSSQIINQDDIRQVSENFDQIVKDYNKAYYKSNSILDTIESMYNDVIGTDSGLGEIRF